MHSIVRLTITAFLCVFTMTAILTLGGLGYLWFAEKPPSTLPYLGWLTSILLAEVIGVVVVLGKKGLSYMPDVKINKTVRDTGQFMREFIGPGSTVTIVSSRLAWLVSDPETLEIIIKKAAAAAKFEIITSQPVAPAIHKPLVAAGVSFFVTGPDHTPEARFTLINGDRSGAERLAIARGTHPSHEITIFDATSGPQIIGLAKDIIRRSKAVANGQ